MKTKKRFIKTWLIIITSRLCLFYLPSDVVDQLKHVKHNVKINNSSYLEFQDYILRSSDLAS